MLADTITAIAAICTAYGVIRGNRLKMKGDRPCFTVHNTSHAGGDWYLLELHIYHGNVYTAFKKISSNALALGGEKHFESYYSSEFKLADFPASGDRKSIPCDLHFPPNNAVPTSDVRVLFKPRKSQRTLSVSFHTSWNFFAAKQTIKLDISRHTD